MDVTDGKTVARIRHLNDLLRCQGVGGEVMVTRSVDALGPEAVVLILRQVAAFTEFTSDNDPYGERDCARISVEGLSIIFKIDCFDTNLKFPSPDPADPTVTRRVMTVMLAEDY